MEEEEATSSSSCSGSRLSLRLPLRSVPTAESEMGGGAASHVMVLFSRGICLFSPESECEDEGGRRSAGGNLLPSRLPPSLLCHVSMICSLPLMPDAAVARHSADA